jgi:hypothetical protein
LHHLCRLLSAPFQLLEKKIWERRKGSPARGPSSLAFLRLRKAAGGALRCSKHPGALGRKPLPFHTTDPSTTLLAQLEAMKLLTWELSLPPFTRVHYAHFQILSFFFPLFSPLFFHSCLK